MNVTHAARQRLATETAALAKQATDEAVHAASIGQQNAPQLAARAQLLRSRAADRLADAQGKNAKD